MEWWTHTTDNTQNVDVEKWRQMIDVEKWRQMIAEAQQLQAEQAVLPNTGWSIKNDWGSMTTPTTPQIHARLGGIDVYDGSTGEARRFSFDEIGMAFAYFHALLLEKGYTE